MGFNSEFSECYLFKIIDQVLTLTPPVFMIFCWKSNLSALRQAQGPKPAEGGPKPAEGVPEPAEGVPEPAEGQL